MSAEQWLLDLFAEPGPSGPGPVLVVDPAFVAPVAAPAGPRHFYRCVGCLDVATTPEPLPLAFSLTVVCCGTCGEHLEYLGRAERDRLITEHDRCACDERCTSARGPRCVCSCTGRNHGAGLAATIRVVVDRGPVPVLVMPSPARAARLLAEYQAYRAARDVFTGELTGLLDRRAGGEFLPREVFTRLLALQRVWRKLSSYRTHTARMKALAV